MAIQLLKTFESNNGTGNLVRKFLFCEVGLWVMKVWDMSRLIICSTVEKTNQIAGTVTTTHNVCQKSGWKMKKRQLFSI